MPAGTLYVVSTPLGNLEDITFRALRVLREVDTVACEDTRRTGLLLQHFNIETPMVACHEHNESRRAREIAARLQAGESMALVSDAGTPTISDPGYRIVRSALDAGLRVVPVPGPCAVTAALAASGLPTDAFLFRGFLPRRRAKRRAAIGDLRGASVTLVLYEAPHRIVDTLADIDAILPGRKVVLAREVTKVHEEFLSGTAAELRRELAGRPAVRGEIVLLIGPADGSQERSDVSLRARVEELESAGLGRMDAIKIAAREVGIGKRAAYSSLEREHRH